MDLLTRGLLMVISDFFSIITIALCLVAKVPQIKTLFAIKSAKGISPTALYLELLSYTVMMSYNYCNGYSFLSYMEYPILLIQEYVLILLVLKYKRKLGKDAYIAAAGYFVVTSLCLSKIIPTVFLALLVPLCTPIGATSKVMQLIEIIRSKDSTSVNLTTWFISAFTNLTRIYTIMVDSADTMLLWNFSINFMLSSTVYLTAYLYKKPKMR